MRDCKNCVHYNGECSAWSCEFIDRDEAVRVLEKYRVLSKVKLVEVDTRVVEDHATSKGE